MNLIYTSVFFNENYIKLLKLLIRSISIVSKLNKENTKILILTSSKLNIIQQFL
jgi:hypothetical protein